MEHSPNKHDWPGAFGAYSPSREAVRRNLGTLVWLALLIIIVASLPSGLRHNHQHVVWPGWPWFAAEILIWLISAWLQASEIITYLAGANRHRISLSDAADAARPVFLKLAVLNLLMVFILLASLLLFVVPFFFVLPRVQLASYFLIDQKLGITQALSASWAATKGHSGQVWGVIGATIVMILPAVTIIGIPFAIYLYFMYQNAAALLYGHIKSTA
jgi:hypothetical protein